MFTSYYTHSYLSFSSLKSSTTQLYKISRERVKTSCFTEFQNIEERKIETFKYSLRKISTYFLCFLYFRFPPFHGFGSTYCTPDRSFDLCWSWSMHRVVLKDETDILTLYVFVRVRCIFQMPCKCSYFIYMNEH